MNEIVNFTISFCATNNRMVFFSSTNEFFFHRVNFLKQTEIIPKKPNKNHTKKRTKQKNIVSEINRSVNEVHEYDRSQIEQFK